MILRFDDRLNTVLKGPTPSGTIATLQWRQIVDILAQRPENLVTEDVRNGLMRLHELAPHVSESERLASVKTLRGRLQSIPLMTYLCADQSPICEEAVRCARLSDAEWAELIPLLSTEAQSVVEEQIVLGPLAKRALPGTGIKDNVLELRPAKSAMGRADAASANPSEAEKPEQQPLSQIGELVAKIEDYRKTHARPVGERSDPPVPIAASEMGRPVNSMRFETDDAGQIIWCDTAPRTAVIGLSIAHPGFGNCSGPDAAGASAFRNRMPMRNARMRLVGSPIVAGEWRMTASPRFDNQSGRFRGFVGRLERAEPLDRALRTQDQLRTQVQMQQLVHELRTPLNAVIGFAEIIEQQLFGPVSSDYRTLAAKILFEGRRLLNGIDDLDVAAKRDSGNLEQGDGTTKAAWLIERIHHRLSDLAASRRVALSLVVSGRPSDFARDADTVERIFTRLLSTCIMVCEEGEAIDGVLETKAGLEPINEFTVSMPQNMRSQTAAQLLDPSSPEDGEPGQTPLLGVGFSLRLVKNLLHSCGGNLLIGDGKITLTLPGLPTSDINLIGTELE